MLIEDLDIEADRLFTGEGIHIAADGIYLARDVLGRAAGRPLEDHVLYEMRDAVDIGVLMTRAGLHPYPHRYRADVVHLLGQNGEAVGQHLALDVPQFFYHLSYLLFSCSI